MISLISQDSNIKISLKIYRNIHDLLTIYEKLAKFPNLKELNICDNEIMALPNDLSKLKHLANLNLNGNNFTNVKNL